MAISALICISVLVTIIETEPTVRDRAPGVFAGLQLFFAVVFGVEYLARVWSAGERPEFSGWAGRLRYMSTPAAIFDLIAVMPFLLGFFLADTFLLRLFRLLRILILARLGRLSLALKHLREAVAERRTELALSLFIALLILVLSSTLMYVVEGSAQPRAFGSIPRALWWSIATLTTVG